MIDCPNCNTQFNAKFPACPRCKKYKTPIEDHKQAIKQKAFFDLESGISIATVTSELRSAGFSDEEVALVVRTASKDIARENRNFGWRNMIIGLLLLLLGWAIGAVLVLPLEDVGRSGLVARKAFGTALWASRALIGIGFFALANGLYTLFTGKIR
jgi:uncharacterized membrane-anchored protein